MRECSHGVPTRSITNRDSVNANWYGRTHATKADCGCRDAGYQKILNAEEERKLLEEGSSRPMLPADKRVEQENSKTLGFAKAQEMDRVKNTWKKAG